MSKKKYDILTLENLLDRKSKQDKISMSELSINSIGANLKIIKIKTRKICEIIDRYSGEIETITNSYDMMCEIIYKSVPILHKQDLKSELDVATPYEIVGELFNFAEMQEIAEHILQLHGLNDVNKKPIEEEIKN